MMWITMFQGGQYFSPSFSGSDPSNSNTSGGLPDRISNGNYPSSQRTVTNWFSAAAFAVPAPGHFGNSGVNILGGPGIALQHMSIVKSFPIKERLRAEFQCMILDLFNTPIAKSDCGERETAVVWRHQLRPCDGHRRGPLRPEPGLRASAIHPLACGCDEQRRVY